MEIKESEVVKQLDEYLFMFDDELDLTYVLDLAAGDSIVETPDRFEIDLVAKPNPIDPEALTMPTHVSIFKRRLAAMEKHRLIQRAPTMEERMAVKNSMHKMAKLVQ